MYFQKQPQMENYIKKYPVGTYRSPTHLHSYFELYFCTSGQLPINIEGRDYVLQAGEAVMIFPFQVHGFTPARDGSGCLFTFDRSYIETFAAHYANYIPTNNVFRYSADPDPVSYEDDLFSLKAFLYRMCADVVRQCGFTYVSAESRVLLERIFTLTEDRFKDCDFSLRVLADMLSYDYVYISKYFLRKTGIRYNSYLNQRRIACAAQLLRKGHGRSVTDVAFSCGYASVRSFNRNFKEVYGKTPQAYMKGFQRE